MYRPASRIMSDNVRISDAFFISSFAKEESSSICSAPAGVAGVFGRVIFCGGVFGCRDESWCPDNFCFFDDGDCFDNSSSDSELLLVGS